jgi:hypothetical protein
LTVTADASLAATQHQKLPEHIAQGSGPLVALHISARKEKQRWPVERFVELAHRLHAEYAARFLVFWSPGDENNPFHPGDDGKAARLLDGLADLPAAPVRTEHLSELIAGLSLCDIAVLSDGGAMHLAAGLGKPQFGVRHFEHQFVVHLQHQARLHRLASSQFWTAIMAILIRSAAVPCIGALIAARSAPWRRPDLLGADFRQPQAAAEHGLDVTLVLASEAGALHVGGRRRGNGRSSGRCSLRGATRSMPELAWPGRRRSCRRSGRS